MGATRGLWDGMGWGSQSSFPLGWDGMGAQCTFSPGMGWGAQYTLSPGMEWDGGPVHTFPWDRMGWGPSAHFPLGWNVMGAPVHTFPWDGMGSPKAHFALDRLFFPVHSLSPAAYLVPGLPFTALEITSSGSFLPFLHLEF